MTLWTFYEMQVCANESNASVLVAAAAATATYDLQLHER